MNEKWEASKWVFWLVGVLLLFTVIGWILMPAGKAVERAVFVNSFQYKEGMADRAATWEANLAELNVRLMSETDEGIRSELLAQKAFLNVQLETARRR